MLKRILMQYIKLVGFIFFPCLLMVSGAMYVILWLDFGPVMEVVCSAVSSSLIGAVMMALAVMMINHWYDEAINDE